MTNIDVKSNGRHLARLHPLAIRVMHWINALTMVVLIMSGWAIYNDEVIFGWLHFPSWMTMGGGPEGALQWHFLAMWILVANGIAYLAYGFCTGRFRRKLLPIRIARDHRRDAQGLGAPARPRRPHALQRGAARALRRHHRRRHPAGALGPGDLEARAVLRARHPLLRLPGRAPRALPRHGRHRRLPPPARGAGADRAEDPGRHADGRTRRAARRADRREPKLDQPKTLAS